MGGLEEADRRDWGLGIGDWELGIGGVYSNSCRR